jgi:two-component system sensor kinase
MCSGRPLRLEHEAIALNDIDHPHLEAVLFQGREHDRFWLVTRRTPHVSLKQRLSRGPVALTDALTISLGVLEGLAELHRHGILHPGIQPEDVICAEHAGNQSARLVWPGTLNDLFSEASPADTLLDAAKYAAPERSRTIHCEVGEASDLYAVGCLLYHCLVGRPPHDGGDLNELLCRQVAENVRGPREVGADVPRALDELLQRLLSREVRDRYQTAEAVVRDLKHLLERLQAGDRDPDVTIGMHDHRASLARPAFVARQAEVAVLDEQIQRTLDGTPQLTVVEGLSGYGKTRLMSEFAIRCARAGVTVFEGRAVQDIGQPFQLLEGVASRFLSLVQTRPRLVQQVNDRLQGQTADLIAALPGLAQVLCSDDSSASPGRVGGESRLLVALVEFLSALGTAEQPAVVILDDGQWADDLLYRLLLRWQVIQAQQPAERRYVQLVVAYRAEDVSEANPLRRIEPGTRVRIGPLHDTQVRKLLESMAGPLPEPAIEVVTRLANGSPFMASAILHGMVESRALVSESQQWKVDAQALDIVSSSSHAAAFLTRRLELLDSVTLSFLDAGALLGAEFTLDMAITLSELTPAEARMAVDNACERHLLWWSRDEGACAFVHSKIREALLARLSAEQKARLHSLAADHLLQFSRDSHAELAVHLDAADRRDESLDHALIAATDALQRHALELSEEQFRIAERAAARAPAATRFRIAEGLGAVHMLRGHYADAETQFDRASQYADGREARAEVCCKRGELSIKRGDMDAALSLFHEGLRLLKHRVPGHRVSIAIWLIWEILTQALHTVFPTLFVHRGTRTPSRRERLGLRMFSGFSHACWYCRSLPLAMWSHLRGMNLGERRAPSLELAQAYSDHAPAMVLPRWISRGVAYAERSLAIPRELDDLWGQGQSLHYLGVVKYAAGRYDECIELCGRAVRILERLGDYWQVHIARYQMAAARYHLGDLQGAVDESRRNHASGMMVGDEQASGIILDVWTRASAGQVPVDLIEQELERERHDAQGTVQVLLAAGVQDLHTGETARAVETLERARRMIEVSGVRNPYTLPIYVWLATALRTMAEEDRSLVPVARHRLLVRAESALRVARLESYRFPNDRPQILRERALIQVMRGRTARARTLFERSLLSAQAVGARYQQALTHAEMARVGQQAGWPDAELLEQTAKAELSEVQTVRESDSDLVAAAGTPSVSLIDRFDTLLKTGRGIVSSLTKAAISEKLEHAAIRLLRAQHASVSWIEDDVWNRADPSAVSGIAGHRGFTESQLETSPVDETRSDLCVPILVRGQAVAALSVAHQQVAQLFGPDEERIAGFLATLAGAAFENAEGFAELEELNATLEQKVADRTASLEERAFQLMAANRELERTTGELRDAQERLLASAEAAEAANAAKGRFLAAMSHEIRTPMNGVIGMAELALATELTSRQRIYLGTISQSARALLTMLNDVLDFSKIEAGKMELESRPFTLHETIVESVRVRSVSAWHKGIDLSTRIFPAVPVRIVGDSTRLRQVLLNLIGNAVKFTSEGSVDVSGDVDEDGMIHLIVRDTGIGIAPDCLRRVFDAFDQGESSITRRFGGTGLGLSICSQIVELMRGSIWVESEPGSGSRFHVKIPAQIPCLEDGELQERTPGPARPGKVLTYASNDESGRVHEAWLDTWQVPCERVTAVNDVKLLLATDSQFDVLLFDVAADAVDDVDVLAQIAESRVIDGERIVGLLPAGAEMAADRAQQAGIRHVLMKPVSPHDLEISLRAVADAGQSISTLDATSQSPSARRSLRLLVVDDSPINLEVASGLLDLMGHDVMTVDSGQAALDKLVDEEFDAVFMDIEMPDMDGIETTRQLREREQHCDSRVPVFAMSAHVLDEVRDECLSVGMDAFVSKPIDPPEIDALLGTLAGQLKNGELNAIA